MDERKLTFNTPTNISFVVDHGNLQTRIVVKNVIIIFFTVVNKQNGDYDDSLTDGTYNEKDAEAIVIVPPDKYMKCSILHYANDQYYDAGIITEKNLDKVVRFSPSL